MTRITYADLVRSANGGHDAFLPSLTRDEVRGLVTSIRGHVSKSMRERDDYWRRRQDNWRSSSERTLAAATATLDRVRAIYDEMCLETEVRTRKRYIDALRMALAGQPEAPCPNNPCDPECDGHQPEAPRGQEDDTGNCTVCNGPVYYGSRHSKCGRLENDLAAANARIAELTEKGYKAARLLIDANARADAAERVALSAERMNATALRVRDQLAARVTELTTNYQTALDAWDAEISERQLQTYNRELAERALEEVRQMRDAAEAQYGAQIVGLRDERDQLAARVTELEAMVPHPGDGSCERCGFAPVTNGLCSDCTCTPEERAELDALDAIPDSELRSAGNWYGWAKPIGVAVLANRAAKAKREQPTLSICVAPAHLSACADGNCAWCKAKRGGA